MKVTMRGTQRYWFHGGLVSLIARKTGWDANQARDFLARNECVYFQGIDGPSAAALAKECGDIGFEVALEEAKGEIRLMLALPYEAELQALREELSALSARLDGLGGRSGSAVEAARVESSPVYQRLAAAPSASPDAAPAAALRKSVSRSTSESAIGKYWLQRAGIFSLVLGIAFFIGYAFRYIGAWGKIGIGTALGALLVGLGGWLASKSGYRKWAMGTIGGGWAILYFTVFASYHLPAARVISNPLVAFLALVAVAWGSIAQALKYRAPVLVFFSYFLAYVAINTGEISFHTLAASLVLGVSAVIVTRKLGWGWLALLSLAAVYATHWLWLEPAIYGIKQDFAGEESFYEALVLPWADDWRVYPLISAAQSALHQGFLMIYWAVFTVLGLLPRKDSDRDEWMSVALLLSNSVVFTASMIHHLHVYYPDAKFLFALAMGGIFLVLAWVEERVARRSLADLYLALAVALFALALPMRLDGPWITYGWAAGCALVAALGVRYGRLVLRIAAWILGYFIGMRLIHYDYLEDALLFRLLVPVRLSFLIFLAAAAGFFLAFLFYEKCPREKEKRAGSTVFLTAAALALGAGFLFGGARVMASPLWIAEGIAVVAVGVALNRVPLQWAGFAVLAAGVLRLHAVDCELPLAAALSNVRIGIRTVAGFAALCALLAHADWLRRMWMKEMPVKRLFGVATLTGAFLLLRFFYDDAVSAWISILWGMFAFLFVAAGFRVREKLYRWTGLGMFALVVLRLFLHDFRQLETLVKIFSFMGLGVVLIAASVIYTRYSKQAAPDPAED